MIYVTSDLHLNHENILTYEPTTRPFASVQEMNEALILNWNSTVNENDTVYVLGDLALGRMEEIEPLVSRLNGKIVLIRGNHDHPGRLGVYKQMGIEIHDIFYLPYKGKFFILCHFPINSPEFRKMVTGDNIEIINLYGHVHSKAPKGFVDGCYHVGVDTNDLTPISIEQIWKECSLTTEKENV